MLQSTFYYHTLPGLFCFIKEIKYVDFLIFYCYIEISSYKNLIDVKTVGDEI
jgi:hypothetical protein